MPLYQVELSHLLADLDVPHRRVQIVLVEECFLLGCHSHLSFVEFLHIHFLKPLGRSLTLRYDSGRLMILCLGVIRDTVYLLDRDHPLPTNMLLSL